MQYAARFQAVVDLLESVWNSDVSEDVAVRGYMKTHRYIGGGDRKEISRIFWDIARKTGRFRALNESLTPRMAVIAFLFYDGKHADEIKAVFSGEKYAPFPLSSDENAFLNALPEKMPDILFEAPEFLRNVIGKRNFGSVKQARFAGFAGQYVKIKSFRCLENASRRWNSSAGNAFFPCRHTCFQPSRFTPP